MEIGRKGGQATESRVHATTFDTGEEFVEALGGKPGKVAELLEEFSHELVTEPSACRLPTPRGMGCPELMDPDGGEEPAEGPEDSHRFRPPFELWVQSLNQLRYISPIEQLFHRQ
ncbi:hypothetical protein PG985_014157 [Apiospora marii]|uniref:Uncharacterized protein n=1 Tax=Apiospora marii TaxID=335849 RepID=A0ABR1R5T0_9PEZI